MLSVREYLTNMAECLGARYSIDIERMDCERREAYIVRVGAVIVSVVDV